MKRDKKKCIREVSLPFSDGLLSAQLWTVGERVVVGVPELGLHCYGASQPEAVFRLFNTLLKYYRQLKSFKSKLSDRGLAHLELLSGWVSHIEDRMKVPSTDRSVLQLTRK